LSIGFTTGTLFTVWNWWNDKGDAQLYVFLASVAMALNLLLFFWEIFLRSIARMTARMLGQAAHAPVGRDLQVASILNLMSVLRSSLLLMAVAAGLGVALFFYGLYLGIFEWDFVLFWFPLTILCFSFATGVSLWVPFWRLSDEMTWTGVRAKLDALGELQDEFLERILELGGVAATRTRKGLPAMYALNSAVLLAVVIPVSSLVGNFPGVTFLLMGALIPIVWGFYFGLPLVRYHSDRLVSFDALHKRIVLEEFETPAAIVKEFAKGLVYLDAFGEPSLMNVTAPVNNAIRARGAGKEGRGYRRRKQRKRDHSAKSGPMDDVQDDAIPIGREER
jgi:hypothetical protein